VPFVSVLSLDCSHVSSVFTQIDWRSVQVACRPEDVRALLILRRVFPLEGHRRDVATNGHLFSWLIDFRLTASRLLCRARA
jgi:hypothetical protein